MNGAELFVKCLENEGVEYIFGLPGEEKSTENLARCIIRTFFSHERITYPRETGRRVPARMITSGLWISCRGLF